MNWEVVAAVAEVLGALGVIASLVYLGGQVKGTGRQSRQAAIQSVVNKIHTVWAALQSDETASIWVRGSYGMANLESETERIRFSAFLFSLMQPYEELYHYRRGGLMDDWAWESIHSTCHAVMGTPGFREWWGMRGDWFSSEFQEHVSATLESSSDYRRYDG